MSIEHSIGALSHFRSKLSCHLMKPCINHDVLHTPYFFFNSLFLGLLMLLLLLFSFNAWLLRLVAVSISFWIFYNIDRITVILCGSIDGVICISHEIRNDCQLYIIFFETNSSNYSWQKERESVVVCDIRVKCALFFGFSCFALRNDQMCVLILITLETVLVVHLSLFE